MTATPDTPWMVARQDRLSYYTPKIVRPSKEFESATRLEHVVAKGQFTQSGTDAYAMAKGFVSITPLSLDHTSRIDMSEVQELIEAKK